LSLEDKVLELTNATEREVAAERKNTARAELRNAELENRLYE